MQITLSVFDLRPFHMRVLWGKAKEKRMKHLKKIVSLVLAVMMLFTMTLGEASASDPTYSITINNDQKGHTYQAYRIFSGELNTVDGETILVNIDWGNGVNGTNLLAALKTAPTNTTFGNAFDSCSNADAVAKVLAGKDSTTDKAFLEAFAGVVGANLGTMAGSASVAADSAEAASYVISGLSAGYYLVKDADNTLGGVYDSHTDLILKLVKNETVTPKSSVPALTKKVHENSTAAGTWQDAADAAIGEPVQFQLTGTMPSTIDTYPTYSYTFHDDLSNGLTLIDDAADTEHPIKVMIGGTDVTSSFTKTTTGLSDGCDLELSCANVKGIDGVTVTEDTEVVVTYYAKLNPENAVIAGTGNPNTAYLEFSNNPNGTGAGKTPVDKVTVFTYELVVNKVDGSSAETVKPPLEGAKFTLYKKNADNGWDTVKEEGNGTTDTTFTFTGLDAGEYKLSETQTPGGYSTADDMIFKVVSVYDTDSADPKLTDLKIKSEDGNTELSGTGGTFTVNMTPTADSKNITTTIQNMKGSSLPSTGGMGTTLFYVVGAILAAGAAVLLVVKRRMSRMK